jgi:hypothetical protein
MAPQTKLAPASSETVDSVEAPIELSIVMPCLNEAETIGICIRKAQRFLAESGISGEIVIADNGSTDGSRQIANAMGARLVAVPERGYGAALQGGIAAAHGRFVAMGDADDSYDFEGLMPFVESLRAGADLVMGNRFAGGIAPGAMPVLHRYLGNPVLSTVGRLFFRVPVKDFHCGLRAFRRDRILALGLASPGMEFASEMVVKSALNTLDIREVPTTLKPDGRGRAPHLRTWRDGWRHLRFLLTYSPRWLFAYPGVALAMAGGTAVATLAVGRVEIGGAELGPTTQLFGAMAVLMGSQLISFGVFARLHAAATGMWPATDMVHRIRRVLTVERGCVGGLALVLAGLIIAAMLLLDWAGSGFGPMDAATMMRAAIPAVLATCLGLQLAFTGFMVGLIAESRPPR